MSDDTTGLVPCPDCRRLVIPQPTAVQGADSDSAPPSGPISSIGSDTRRQRSAEEWDWPRTNSKARHEPACFVAFGSPRLFGAWLAFVGFAKRSLFIVSFAQWPMSIDTNSVQQRNKLRRPRQLRLLWRLTVQAEGHHRAATRTLLAPQSSH